MRQLIRSAPSTVHPDALALPEVLLAVSGKRCVGAGIVEIFRQDLLLAKVRDGYAGSIFKSSLPQTRIQPRLWSG